MIQHTPGPWKIGSGLSKYSASIDINGDGVWIGSIHGDHITEKTKPSGGFPSNDEAEANARLIAAAPELLETLQALMGTCCHRVEWTRKWPNVVEKCRAAIAKTRKEPDEGPV